MEFKSPHIWEYFQNTPNISKFSPQKAEQAPQNVSCKSYNKYKLNIFQQYQKESPHEMKPGAAFCLSCTFSKWQMIIDNFGLSLQTAVS